MPGRKRVIQLSPKTVSQNREEGRNPLFFEPLPVSPLSSPIPPFITTGSTSFSESTGLTAAYKPLDRVRRHFMSINVGKNNPHNRNNI